MELNLSFHLLRSLINAAISIYFFINGIVFLGCMFFLISIINYCDHLNLIKSFEDDDDLNTSA